MANKITIRRVGGILPALSLVVLVLLATVITWLSTAGLPGAALRRIEAAAAKQGLYLHIDLLKLSPASGLAVRARGVTLFASQGDTQPLATVERMTLGISAGALLRGHLQPTMAEFWNLDAALPTDGEAPLRIENATFSSSIRQGRFVRLTAASARVEGIPVTVRGAFLLPEELLNLGTDTDTKVAAEPPPAPLNLAALLHPWQKQAGVVQRAIAAQQWTKKDCPSVELQLEALRNTQLSARITIPRYDEGQFHFRDAALDVACQNNAVIINKAQFRTVEPNSEVTLQGGYDLSARHLSLHLDSTAALTRMVEAVKLPELDMDAIRPWLQRFHHPDDDPPRISLRGDVYFEENFSLQALSVLGQISQEDFRYGDTEIDKLELSFFYKDGTFNIDRLQLAFPTGSLTASASASDETGKGKARLSADLDIPQLLRFASEFTPEPLVLPEGLELTGNLQLEAGAELDMPAFIAGSTELGQFLPTIHRLELGVGIDKASHHGCSLERPRLSININHLHKDENELLPRALEQAQFSLRADALHFPQQEGEASPCFQDAELKLELNNLSMEREQGAETSGEAPAASLTPLIESAHGVLKLGTLKLPGFSAKAVEVELVDAANIRPLAKDWRQLLQQGMLRLNTGAMHAEETLLGALDSKLELDAEGHLDITAILDREGNRLHLDLHPQLTDDGLLELEQVALELPAAGFAPLLDLAGISLTQIRLPDTLFLAGNACIDTRSGHLRTAECTLNIPCLIRTPGDGVAAFKGKEIPLTLHLEAQANGREGGHIAFHGGLLLTHRNDERKGEPGTIQLSFRGDTASHVHLEGTNTMDVGIVDQLIDLRSAHSIMRDFHTHAASRTDVDIRAVDVNWAGPLCVTASCDAHIRHIGYQLGAYVDEKDTSGKRIGKETLRTDFGKDPFRHVEKAEAHVDVIYRENARGEQEACSVAIRNADITYDNRPWLASQGIKGGTPSSRLRGDAIIIDIQDSFVELKNVRGLAYPSYAIGAYYDDLPGFLDILEFKQPVQLETEHCLFPIYHDCPHDMSGCIRVLADEAGFRFLGTTFPLTSFSGFIWFKKGAVCLDRLNAACWEGALNAALVIDYSGKRTGFDGYASLRNLNLKPLAAAYGSKQQPALCNGDIRFRTPTPDIRDLEAYGNVHIMDGDLMNLTIFRPVGALITDLPGNLAALERITLHREENKPGWLDSQVTKLFKTTGDAVTSGGEIVSHATNNLPFANHFLRYDLQEVHSRFTIGNGHLVTEGMKALGYNLNIDMQMDADLEKLTLNGDLWPKISSVPTILLSPITFLSRFIIDIHLFGPLDDIQWEFRLNQKIKSSNAPASVTDEAADNGLKPRCP